MTYAKAFSHKKTAEEEGKRRIGDGRENRKKMKKKSKIYNQQITVTSKKEKGCTIQVKTNTSDNTRETHKCL